MSVFARPSADTNNSGAYVNQIGATTNLYQSIDEAVIDDSDYISSPALPASAVYVTKLGTVTDPGVDTGMILFARLFKDVGGAGEIDFTVELRQGYVNESSQGTLIATLTATNVTTTPTDYQYNLTSGEGASITDFSDLYMRFVANQI